MYKLWEVAPKAREDFFNEHADLDRALAQILYNRHIRSTEEIESFLHGRFEDCSSPALFNQMEEAVSKVIFHIKAGNRICIYGDYDADGMTSTALLFEIFSTLRADCFPYIPERTREGYGLNKEAIEKIIKKGTKLIVTVDGGIRNRAEVAFAQERGVEVVITDHHTPPVEDKDLPDCLIVNPHMRGEKYPFKFLAGVGVAFKLAQAIIERSKLSAEHKSRLADRVLDLVAIGTVSDCMPLTGENRLLLKKGLEVLNERRRIGIRAMMKAAGLESKQLEAWNIGFQIGPRLNASSRMGSAGNAFNLLVTKDKKEAEEEAERLNERNARRQKETEEIVGEVEEQIKKQLDEKIIIGICPDKEKHWNEGIIGLVAEKISEKYYKPCLVITKGEEGYKGSGRSIEEFNLFKAIEECGDLLLKRGGHPRACGFSAAAANLRAFADKMRQIARRELDGKSLEPKLKIDCEWPLENITSSFHQELKRLAPFGQGNPQPKFLSTKAQIKDIMKMGADGKHIKFRFNSLWGIGFGRAEEWQDLKIGDLVDIVYTVEENEFNGNVSLQLKLVDVKFAKER